MWFMDFVVFLFSFDVIYKIVLEIESWICVVSERVGSVHVLKTIAVNKVTNRWRNHKNKTTKISELNKIIELYEL